MCVYGVLGCTDSTATNYLPIATAEHAPSTCELPREGCTIPQNTLNYDSLAVQLAGCVYVQLGCTDSTATNFLPNANTDSGLCSYAIYGCADPSAFNYDSLATVSTGCVVRVVGCSASMASNYASDANTPLSVRASCPVLYPCDLLMACRARAESFELYSHTW